MKLVLLFHQNRLRNRCYGATIPERTAYFLPARYPLIPPLLVLIGLLLFNCLTVAAHQETQPVTLSFKNASLETVFAEIKKQTGYNFIYTREQLKHTRKVSLDVRNEKLEKVLELVFKDQPVTFSMLDKYVVVKKKGEEGSIVTPTTKDISGRVINEKGVAVPNTTIFIKGTNESTMTNEQGAFVLRNIPRGSRLVATSVGYEPAELILEDQSELLIQLKVHVNELNSVEITVNTGYQQVSRERFVGSVSKLDSTSYQRRAGVDIISRLDGTVTGVLFNRSNGTAPVQIRGISTLGGGPSFDPLIIVDNFPFTGDLSNINQNDILDITVLKDATAASIWGTRAGNGVIVITTKKAKYNQNFQVTLSSNITIREKPDLFYFPQMSSSDFIDVEKFLFEKNFYSADLINTNYPVISPVVELLHQVSLGNISQASADEQIDKWRSLDLRNDFDKYVNTNAVLQQHHVTLGGGNSFLNYNLSLGFNHQVPGIRGSKADQQYTISSNNTFRPARNVEIETSINLGKSIDQSTNLLFPLQAGGGKSNMYPYAQLADANGAALPVPKGYRMTYVDTAGGGRLLDWHYRPLDEIRNADRRSVSDFVRLNLGISWRINDWLKVEVRDQFLQQKGTVTINENMDMFSTRDLINQFSQIKDGVMTHKVPEGSIIDLSHSNLISNNLRGQLSVSKSWGGLHDLSAMVAGEVSESKRTSEAQRLYGYDERTGTHASGMDYQTFFPTYDNILNFGSARIPDRNRVGEEFVDRFISLLANASYIYRGRYSLYASARRDGANLFGVNTNNRWKPLWSVGGSWDLSKEEWYKIKWVPALKLRASFGYSGNVANYLSGKPTITYEPARSSYTGLIIAGVGNAPNPNLKWEEVKTINLGVDASFLNNRITAGIDVFEKRSEDVISLTPIDITSGVPNYTVNVASLKAHGLEINIRSVNTNGKVRWESGFGLSYVKTIVTKYDNGGFTADFFSSGGLNPSQGRIAWGLSSFRWAGLDPATGDPQGYYDKTISKDYASILADSVQNQVFHGSGLPLISGFLNNAISWKQFSLSFNITWRLKYFVRRPTISYELLFQGWVGHADYVKRWKQPGDEKVTNVPSMTFPVDVNRERFYQSTEVTVSKGDHLRLQDLRLQYNLAGKRPESIIKRASLFIYANNLNVFLWRAERTGLDPDYPAMQHPLLRTWAIGFNATL